MVFGRGFDDHCGYDAKDVMDGLHPAGLAPKWPYEDGDSRQPALWITTPIAAFHPAIWRCEYG